MTIQTVILAAGLGKRMQSNLPKVLHQLAGKPMLSHVIAAGLRVSREWPPIVVYGHQGQAIIDAFPESNVMWVQQKEQLGTGHALLQALPRIQGDQTLVLYGDVPLISEATIKQLIEHTPAKGIGMVTATLPDASGYGRIKRNKAKQVIGIVEEKDATAKERAIKEINTGIYLIPTKLLKKWLPALKNKNAQNEYYLTDMVSFAKKEKIRIYDVKPNHIEEVLGVNDRVQLALLERFYQRQQAEKLMRQGVTIIDPARIDIRGEVECGKDVIIDVNVVLEGRIIIGNECTIGANSLLCDVELGERVQIKPHSILEGADIASDCVIGPFARLRTGSLLAQGVRIGNFVEIKNSEIGSGTKINHLSYIGDSDIGKRVNIGAGTITCNYDGANKHKTVIGDEVHIGSDTQLVAPVVIGTGADIGAGSTIAKDVPAAQLTLSHQLNQRTVPGWQRPIKKTLRQPTE